MTRVYALECKINGALPLLDRPSTSQRDRMEMHNDNALKIGLFGANCSSGRAATKVPERWSASWADYLALARMADEAGIDFMLPIGRWKGYGGDTDYTATTLETITWATGLLAATKRITVFGTVHAPLFHPIIAAKQMRHRRPRRRGPLRAQHRRRLERGRVRDVRRRSSASTRRATTTRRNGSTPSSWRGVRSDDFDFDGAVHQAEEGARQAQALWRHAAADHERRRLRRPARPSRSATATPSSPPRRRRASASRRPRKMVKPTSRPRPRRIGREIEVYHRRRQSPAGRPRRRPRTTTTTPSSRMADWGAVDGMLAIKNITPQTVGDGGIPDDSAITTPHGIGGYAVRRRRRTTSPSSWPISAAPACAASRFSFVNYLDELPYFCDEVLPRLEKMGVREAH